MGGVVASRGQVQRAPVFAAAAARQMRRCSDRPALRASPPPFMCSLAVFSRHLRLIYQDQWIAESSLEQIETREQDTFAVEWGPALPAGLRGAACYPRG
jgi:hypothetical protein